MRSGYRIKPLALPVNLTTRNKAGPIFENQEGSLFASRMASPAQWFESNSLFQTFPCLIHSLESFLHDNGRDA